MNRKEAETAIVTAALVTASAWGYRKLIEPVGSEQAKASKTPHGSHLRSIAGLEPTPPNTAEFAVAFGFTFMSLSVIATFAPDLAGGVAVIVAVGDLLTNGGSVFKDVNNVVAESAKRQAAAEARQGIASNPATGARR